MLLVFKSRITARVEIEQYIQVWDRSYGLPKCGRYLSTYFVRTYIVVASTASHFLTIAAAADADYEVEINLNQSSIL